MSPLLHERIRQPIISTKMVLVDVPTISSAIICCTVYNQIHRKVTSAMERLTARRGMIKYVESKRPEDPQPFEPTNQLSLFVTIAVLAQDGQFSARGKIRTKDSRNLITVLAVESFLEHL